MFCRIKPKNLLSKLYLAIWRNDIKEVIEIASKDSSLINQSIHITLPYSPFHFSLRLRRTEIAERLLRDFDCDFLQKAFYSTPRDKIRFAFAAETAINSRMEFLFEKYSKKIPDEVKKVVNKHKSKSSIELFEECMIQYNLEDAFYHFESASLTSIDNFSFSTSSFFYLTELARHNNFKYFVKFVDKLKLSCPRNAAGIVFYCLGDTYRTNLKCCRYLLEVFPDCISDYTLEIKEQSQNKHFIFDDRVYKALDHDDVDEFKQCVEAHLRGDEGCVVTLTDKHSSSPLYVAASSDSFKIIKYMIESRFYDFITHTNNQGADAFLPVSCRLNLDILEFFLSNMDPNYEDDLEALEAYSELFSFEKVAE